MCIKITVIIPVYNIAPHLPRCLDSVLAQTYPHLEVVAVDDGSTDGSGSILDEYAAKDPRVIAIHQKNGGVTSARLAGLRAASGDWFGFVDGDDFVEPDMYQRLLDNALKYGADISHCGYRMVFPRRVDYYDNTGRLAQQDRLTGLKDLLDGSMIEPGLWNKLYHKSLLQSLFHSEAVEPDIKINEDLLMNFFLFRAAENAVYEDFCPYHYIVRQGSAANSRNRECHVTDPIRVARRLVRETREIPSLYPLALRLYARRLIGGSMQTNFPVLAAEARQELLRMDFRRLPRKERYMALLAAWAPPAYRAVRRVYDSITRADHKYDLE